MNMLDLGPHSFYIILSYIFTILIVIKLTLWIVLFERKQKKTLDFLEAQGITRRSDKAKNSS